jgi:hypothetical protein
MVITTDKGGLLEFNFVSGKYTYTAPTATADFTEEFVYTIKDGNGDTDDASLKITVQNQPEAPDAKNDRIYTNISGLVTVNDALLLKNDKDADTAHGSLIITSVAAAAGQATFFENATPAHAGTSTTFDIDEGNENGELDNGETTSFTYVVKDPVLQDVGTVSITRDTSGSINGSDQDDILIGNNAGLDGGAGNDHMVGTGTNDLLDYSDVDGNWSITLGAGGSGTASVEGEDTYEGIDGVIGGDDNNTITGNELANLLEGGGGNDTLDGGNDAAADTLNGGSGNDTLIFRTFDDTYNGGGNTDILDVSHLATVNFTGFTDSKIESVETLRLTGGSGTTVTLNANDVINFEGGTINPGGGTPGENYGSQPVLTVTGEAGDTVNLTSGAGDTWFNASANGASGIPAGFTLYVHVASGGNPADNENAYVLIQNGVSVNLS